MGNKFRLENTVRRWDQVLLVTDSKPLEVSGRIKPPAFSANTGEPPNDCNAAGLSTSTGTSPSILRNVLYGNLLPGESLRRALADFDPSKNFKYFDTERIALSEVYSVILAM